MSQMAFMHNGKSFENLYLPKKKLSMIILLSPAKTLDYSHEKWGKTKPKFAADSLVISKKLKKMSRNDLRELMSISEKLADLNYERNQLYSESFNKENSRAALYAFKGDVYQGLQAGDFTEKEVEFANTHVRILSGLYGYLRPQDKMQPYRLEMGTRLPIGRNGNLYEFWGTKISEQINKDLKGHKDPSVLNLASKEYFHVVKREMHDNIIDVDFKEMRKGKLTFVSFSAKKARGLMTRYIVKNNIDTIEKAKGFNLEEYCLDENLSTDKKLTFTR